MKNCIIKNRRIISNNINPYAQITDFKQICRISLVIMDLFITQIQLNSLI
jgi:hypothetical protein